MLVPMLAVVGFVLHMTIARVGESVARVVNKL